MRERIQDIFKTGDQFEAEEQGRVGSGEGAVPVRNEVPFYLLMYLLAIVFGNANNYSANGASARIRISPNTLLRDTSMKQQVMATMALIKPVTPQATWAMRVTSMPSA